MKTRYFKVSSIPLPSQLQNSNDNIENDSKLGDVENDLLALELNERGYCIARVIEELDDNMQSITKEFKEKYSNRYTPTSIQVLGMLPNESGIASSFKKKDKEFFASIVSLEVKSIDRIEPTEKESYMASSPLQIMTYNAELLWKEKYVNSLYSSYLPNNTKIDIFTNNQIFGYRNKVEFGFYEDRAIDGKEYNLYLSFFKREGNKGKYTLEQGSMLMPDNVNDLALAVVEVLKKYKVSAKSLKTLLLRSSSIEQGSIGQKGGKYPNIIASLYVTDKELLKNNTGLQEALQELSLNKFGGANNPTNEDVKNYPLVAINVIFSNGNSPASITTNRLCGNQFTLSQKLKYGTYDFSVDGFFQINPIVFCETITDIETIVKKISPAPSIIMDMYCGVGVIGQELALSLKSDKELKSENTTVNIIGVDLSSESNELTVANASQNGVSNYKFIPTSAKSAINQITKKAVIILDPPRIGLEQEVVDKLIEIKPAHVIYLSCNPATQARDFRMLKRVYKIEYIKGYNYYPRTTHLESLIYLTLK